MSGPLHYPKIPDSRNFPAGPCIAFEKYDGTNLHYAWHRDFGWHAFGTRRDEFNLDPAGTQRFQLAHPGLDEAAELFLAGFAAPLQAILLTDPGFAAVEECVAFLEFLGPGSFAGAHQADDAKQLVLFDVQVDGDLLDPFEFVDLFGQLPIARVVYRGRFHGGFTEDVRNGRYDVAEGVVCKTGSRGQVHMAKIKTRAYLEKLQQSFGRKWQNYWE